MPALDPIAYRLPAEFKKAGHIEAQKWLYQFAWTHFITLTFPEGETSYKRAKDKLSDLVEDLERLLYTRRAAGRRNDSSIFYIASYEDRFGLNKHLHCLLLIPASQKLRHKQSIKSLCEDIWIGKYKLGHQLDAQELNTIEGKKKVVDYTLKQTKYNSDRLIIKGA